MKLRYERFASRVLGLEAKDLRGVATASSFADSARRYARSARRAPELTIPVCSRVQNLYSNTYRDVRT